MDFWRKADPADQSLTTLLYQNSIYRNVPVTAVVSHQEMLSSVDDSGADCLINVDEHDDLINLKQDLTDGNWISYVKWRQGGTYIWVCSYEEVQNFNTHEWRKPHRRLNKEWYHGSQWANNQYLYGRQSIDLCQYLVDLVGIGIALSPGYAPPDVQEVMQRLMAKYEIPITGTDKGWGRTGYIPALREA